MEESLQVKARSVKLGIAQRAAVHCSSQVDNDEAYMAGAAVQAAVTGHTDKMVTLFVGKMKLYLQNRFGRLIKIANGLKLPESWINEDGFSMNYNFYKYALP